MKDKIYAVGIDLGNGFTNYLSQRTGEGGRFATKVSPLVTDAFDSSVKETHKVEIGGKRYIVGSGVSLEVNDVEIRINSNEYKIALLTAIAKSLPRSGYAKVNLCVGLPIVYLESYADDLENIIKSWTDGANGIEIKVDGEDYEIKLNQVTVFAEGALSMIEDLGEGKVLTIDMGSGTVDCIEFIDGEPGNTYTVTSSMRDIYTAVADRFKSSEYKMKQVSTDLVEEYIGKEVVERDRKVINISSHFEDIRLGVQAISNEISSRFRGFEQYKRVILMGGASILTFNYWEERINGIELVEDAQYVNVKVFQMVAEAT